MIDDKRIEKLSKTFKSFDRKIDKLYEKYNKDTYKYGCLSCKKRGNPEKIPFENLHDKCLDCPHASSVLPDFKALVEFKKDMDKFIDEEYAPAVYESLSQFNPVISGPRQVKKRFNEWFKGPFNRLGHNEKELIVYINEGAGLYRIEK